MAMKSESLFVAHNERTGEKGVVVDVRRWLPEVRPEISNMPRPQYASVVVRVERDGKLVLEEWPSNDKIVIYS